MVFGHAWDNERAEFYPQSDILTEQTESPAPALPPPVQSSPPEGSEGSSDVVYFDGRLTLRDLPEASEHEIPHGLASLGSAGWKRVHAINSTCGEEFDMIVSDERDWVGFSNQGNGTLPAGAPPGVVSRLRNSLFHSGKPRGPARPKVIIPATDEWKEACSALHGVVRRVDALREGAVTPNTQFLQKNPSSFSFALTTFRGRATLDHAMQSWKRSGIFDHPKFDELVFHVNKCGCEDLRQIRELVGGGNSKGVRYKVICTTSNSLHPVVLARLISHSRSALTIMTENDRPIVPRPGETERVFRARVRRFLDLSINVTSGAAYLDDGLMRDAAVSQVDMEVDIARPGMDPAGNATGWESRHLSYIATLQKLYHSDGRRAVMRGHSKRAAEREASLSYPTTPTPYVFLERQTHSADDKFFFDIVSEIKGYSAKEAAAAFTTHRARNAELTDKVWDVIEHNRTDWPVMACWHSCYKFVHATPTQRHQFTRGCRRLLRVSKSLWNSCEWRTCREWIGWISGSGDGPSNCLNAWLRTMPLPSGMESRLISMMGSRENGGPISCFRMKGWSNGPALFNTHWYRKDIGSLLCGANRLDGGLAHQAGLVYRKNKPHFGWYGRQMEYDLQSFTRRSDGIPHCRGEGLMDHVEIESFDGERVGR